MSASKVASPRVVNIADLRKLARARLPDAVFDYLDGGAEDERKARHVATLAVHWMGMPGWGGVASLRGEPLPLVAFEQPCLFYSASTAALDSAGIPWRVAFASPSLGSHWAAVLAGLGIAMRPCIAMPNTLSILDPVRTGLPVLPDIQLYLETAEIAPSRVVERLGDILAETIGGRT